MEIIPAIDLKNGKCVRLYQGNYDRETVFSEDPLEIALRWQAFGAHRLHIVDLDGADQGILVNQDIIRQIAITALVPIQIGGGIRRIETVKELLKMGVDRIILGTMAVEDPQLISDVCRNFAESVAISIDTRDGWVATHAWRQETRLNAIEFAKSMVKLGVKRFIYTDIGRDGTLTEPNFTAIAEMVNATRLPVIASGGISSLLHVKMLKQLGAEGVIIGRALYTGDIDLKQALAAISG